MPDTVMRRFQFTVDGKANLGPVNAQLREASQLASTFGRSLTSAFQSAVLDGRKMKDVLRQLTQELSRTLLATATKPLEQGLTNFFTAMLTGGTSGPGGWLTWVNRAAKGMVLDRGRIAPFAQGGIVNRPTLFPMANGAGLMGEAGPEAILPLRRGPDGRLGVAAGGQGGGLTFNMSINPDFRGADANAVAALSVKLAQLEKSIPDAVVTTIERAKAVRPGILR